MSAELWARVRELREEGVDSSTAYQQAREERSVEAAVADLDLDDDGDASGTCPIPEAVSWVADNIERSGVKPSDAPSATGWMLLKWSKASEVNKSEFIKSIWAKLIPSRGELENQSRYADDGSTQIELAERILARIEGQRDEDERQRLIRKAAYERNGAGVG